MLARYTPLLPKRVISPVIFCREQDVKTPHHQGAIPAMMEKFKPLITPQLIHETGVSFVLDLTDSKWTLDLKESGKFTVLLAPQSKYQF